MKSPTPRTRSQLITLYHSWSPYQQRLFREGQEDSRIAGRTSKLEAENWAADVIEHLAGYCITEREHVTLREPGKAGGASSSAASGESIAARAAELIGRYLR